MNAPKVTSMQRVLTTLEHKEPDRVPFFLLASLHGARELGLSIEEYFFRAETVVEGQLRMLTKYRHDCLSAFFYASIEVEAWGGEVVYSKDGPVNSGQPIIAQFDDITRIQPPRIDDCACLTKVLRAIEIMKARTGDQVPIVAVVISPFSLPVMQMGFHLYLELLHEQPPLFEQLMKVNEEFCVAWANAQLKSGATALAYIDPVSSTTIIPRELYLRTGFPVARRTLARIQGPTATHFASGRCLPILDEVAQTGTSVVGVSAQEDLKELKDAVRGKLSLLGNLDGITMRRWSTDHATAAVKQAISGAGPGGGFILSDNHGEIPWQVSEDVLMAISEAVHRWGSYPLNWIDRREE
jgi:uroporphyrinogen decarboxylase